MSGLFVSLATRMAASLALYAQADGTVKFMHAAAGAVARTLAARLSETCYVRDFGAVGDGVADDTPAFNLAIAYANLRGGIDAPNITGTTIEIGDGRYKLGALNAITKSGCRFVGASSDGAVLLLTNGTTAFTWGDGVNIIVGGGVKGVKYEYTVAPSATTIVHKLSYAFRLQFDDSMLVNIGTLLQLGTAAGAPAGGIACNGMDGYVNNGGRPLFDMRFGAGLTLNRCAVFVGGVTNPVNAAFTASFATSVMTVTAITGTPLAVGQYVHAAGVAPGTTITSLGTGTGGLGTYNLSSAPGTLAGRTTNATGVMSTAAGTSVFQMTAGNWDTLQAVGCIFERFDVGVSIVAAAGMVYQNLFFSNVVMDYLRRYAIYAESQAGGVVSTIRTDKACWFSTWENDAVILTGAGYHDGHDLNGTITIAGIRGINYALTNAKAVNIGMQISACNRIGTAAAAIDIAAGAKGFNISGTAANWDTSAVGLPWRAPYGLQIAADADSYLVESCNFDGATAGYNVLANAAGSGLRRINGNVNASYAGFSALAMPASAATYTNTTPFVQSLDFTGGTLSTGYSKNAVGISGALAYLHMRLEPGETFACGYTVAPTVIRFNER